MNGTRCAISPLMKCTSRDKRSSLATTTGALSFRAALSAAVAQALVGHYGEKNATLSAELALLWEVARDFRRATDCFRLAAQNAVRTAKLPQFALREKAAVG